VHAVLEHSAPAAWYSAVRADLDRQVARVMSWVVLGVIVFAVVVRLAKRRRAQFTMLPSEPLSTMHLQMAKKHTSKTRAALDAATSSLR
jgi:predicted site-specific integrase-resolvase